MDYRPYRGNIDSIDDHNCTPGHVFALVEIHGQSFRGLAEIKKTQTGGLKMEKIKCEICGKEFERGINLFGLFGQKACSDGCMEALAKKQVAAKTAKIASGLRLNSIEKNNAKYSSNDGVNQTSLWLTEAAKNHRAGKHSYAAECFLNAVSGKKYI